MKHLVSTTGIAGTQLLFLKIRGHMILTSNCSFLLDGPFFDHLCFNSTSNWELGMRNYLMSQFITTVIYHVTQSPMQKYNWKKNLLAIMHVPVLYIVDQFFFFFFWELKRWDTSPHVPLKSLNGTCNVWLIRYLNQTLSVSGNWSWTHCSLCNIWVMEIEIYVFKIMFLYKQNKMLWHIFWKLENCITCFHGLVCLHWDIYMWNFLVDSAYNNWYLTLY